jgi:signal peptidase II
LVCSRKRRRFLRRRNILFAVVVCPVILLDQLTKGWIIATMPIHDSFPIIEGFFNIVHVRNPGAAFGFLAGASPLFRSVFFIAVTLAAIFLILHYLRHATIEEPLLVLSLALILSGAIGNLIDRIRFGEVVDFLDVYVKTYHWPAFNVADSAISIGASLLVVAILMQEKKRKGSVEPRK